MPNGVGFPSHCSPYSNLHMAPITEGDIDFICNGQYIMYERAVICPDGVASAKMLSESNPYTIMFIGKSIKPNDEWQKCEKGVFKKAVKLRFEQNPELKKKIKDTTAKQFYGCTYHPVFGAGFNLQQIGTDAAKPKTTHGNYMGRILTEYKVSLDQE